MKVENIENCPGYYISKRGVLWSRKGGTWVKIHLSYAKRMGRTRAIIYNKYSQRVHVNISRLVAERYVENPMPGFYNVVCHIDNNPRNNTYTNLYWGDTKDEYEANGRR